MSQRRALVLSFVTVALALSACGKKSPPPRKPADAGAQTNPLSADECRSIYSDAEMQANNMWSGAKRDCSNDADCVPGPRSGCLSTDCGGSPIAKASLGDLTKAREALTPLCDQWAHGNCPDMAPVEQPTCPGYRVSCEDGKCTAH